METIGNRLRTARESRDLSIEDAAHRTRIQAIYIRGLENDDFSNFPSTTYAKSFLTLYSRFLDVDAEDALQQFAGGDAISLSGQGYLESVTDNIAPRRPSSPYASQTGRPSNARRSQAASPGMAPLFLGLVLLALVIAIPTFWILGKDSDSMEDVVSKAGDLTNGTFTTADPQAEKIEPKPAVESAEDTSTPGPPSPESTPDQKPEPEPAEVPPIPKETKVAQVIPPKSGDRSLDTQPGGASPVITKTKPRESGAAPVRELPAKPKPKVTQETPPATSPNAGQPLRAVPLIARPVIEPEASEAEEAEPAAEDGGSFDPQESGNRYPRRSE